MKITPQLRRRVDIGCRFKHRCPNVILSHCSSIPCVLCVSARVSFPNRRPLKRARGQKINASDSHSGARGFSETIISSLILRAFAASREIGSLWKRASREAAKAQRTRKPRGVETYGLSWEHRSRRFPNKPSRTLAPFFFGPKTSHATCQNRLHRRCREYCTPCDFRHSTVFLA